MSGFLSRLSQRVVAPAGLVCPRTLALFDPESPVAAQPEQRDEERAASMASNSHSSTRADRVREHASRAAEPASEPALPARATRQSKLGDERAPAPSAQQSVTSISQAIAVVTHAIERAQTPVADAERDNIPIRAAEVMRPPGSTPDMAVHERMEESAETPPPSSPPRADRPDALTEVVQDRRPSVRVTIGRIEVRPPAAPARTGTQTNMPRTRATMALDDYLSGARRK